MKIEVIVQQAEEALEAAAYGADRVELVSAIHEGGLTPDDEVLESTLKQSSIPVHVMIRPHARSFVYNDHDREAIMDTIGKVSRWGGKNIVFGALQEDGSVDMGLLQKITQTYPDMTITFHRAIDDAASLMASYESVAAYTQVKHILTSGGAADCKAGKDALRALVAKAWEINGPNIMPGGGLTPENIARLHPFIQADAYHFGKAVRIERSFANGLDETALEKVISHTKPWKDEDKHDHTGKH